MPSPCLASPHFPGIATFGENHYLAAISSTFRSATLLKVPRRAPHSELRRACNGAPGPPAWRLIKQHRDQFGGWGGGVQDMCGQTGVGRGVSHRQERRQQRRQHVTTQLCVCPVIPASAAQTRAPQSVVRGSAATPSWHNRPSRVQHVFQVVVKKRPWSRSAPSQQLPVSFMPPAGLPGGCRKLPCHDHDPALPAAAQAQQPRAQRTPQRRAQSPRAPLRLLRAPPGRPTR